MNFDFLNNKKIQFIINKLQDKWFFVGGVVRDGLLGLHTYDIDITTTIKPEEIENYFKDDFTLNVIGRKFGTIAIFAHPYTVEITTTRQDIKCDGRWAEVNLIESFEEDSKRRDFTINALLFNGKKLVDYHKGIDHLQKKQVIFVGNPAYRMREDYLRTLRFIRFFVRFSQLETVENIENYPYFTEIQETLKHLNFLAKERISSEIKSMCKYPSVNDAVKMLNIYGFSKTLFKQDLSLIPNKFSSVNDRLAFLFLNIPSKKTGLPKAITQLKFLLTPSLDYAKKAAVIWSKYRSLEKLNKFFYYHDLKCDPMPNLLIDFDILTIEPKQRSDSN